MYKVFTNLWDHYTCIAGALADRPVGVDVLTYSTGQYRLNLEVDGKAQSYPSAAARCLETVALGVKSKRIRQARVVSCLKPDDIADYVALMEQGVKWRLHASNHCKAWIFHYRTKVMTLVGSRNLTTSHSPEISVLLDNHKENQKISLMFEQLWVQSTPLAVDQDWFTQAKEAGL